MVYAPARSFVDSNAAERGSFSKSVVGGVSKRLFDVAFSLIALASLPALFIVISAVIFFTNRGPILFSHERVGQGGRMFHCLKFRTMQLDADRLLAEHLAENEEARRQYERDHKLKKDPRIIPLVGHFLRKTSLDELPQFINVLRGEMSVVGPRPVTIAELAHYKESAGEVLRARPGITGSWQVSGRSNVSYDQRVQLDLDYVREWSFRQDILIVLRTLKVILSCRGAY